MKMMPTWLDWKQ